MMGSTKQYLDWARRVLRTETLDLNEVADTLDGDFVHAADALLHYKGRVIITDMGKSGHVGRKIAATMAPTGTPTFFVHPAETTRGDLGIIVDNDVMVVISNPGESDEITATIPALKRENATLIGIAAHPASTLARYAGIHIATAVSKEACPLGLTPTTSTTAVMTLGDALAVVLLHAHVFTSDGLTLSHPAGSLSERLLLRVADIMHDGDALPAVVSGTLLKETTVRMNEKGLGMLAVTDEAGRLKSVLIDGDLRRLFQQRGNFAGLTVDSIMHTFPKTITADKLATEALKHMQTNHIDSLLVAEADGTLTSALNMHDLLMARIVRRRPPYF